MNPVSFGSIYKIYFVSSDLGRQKQGQQLIRDYCSDNDIFTKTRTYREPQPANFLGQGEKVLKTFCISATKDKDHKIDMICNNYQIKHEKITDNEIVVKNWTGQRSFHDQIRTLLGSFCY